MKCYPLNISQVSCITQTNDRYKTACFELLEMTHCSTSVDNIAEEKASEA